MSRPGMPEPRRLPTVEEVRHFFATVSLMVELQLEAGRDPESAMTDAWLMLEIWCSVHVDNSWGGAQERQAGRLAECEEENRRLRRALADLAAWPVKRRRACLARDGMRRFAAEALLHSGGERGRTRA